MFRVPELLEIYDHYCFCSFIIVFNSSTLENLYDKNNTHGNNTKLIALYKMALLFSVFLLSLDFWHYIFRLRVSEITAVFFWYKQTKRNLSLTDDSVKEESCLSQAFSLSQQFGRNRSVLLLSYTIVEIISDIEQAKETRLTCIGEFGILKWKVFCLFSGTTVGRQLTTNNVIFTLICYSYFLVDYLKNMFPRIMVFPVHYVVLCFCMDCALDYSQTFCLP